MTGVSLALLVSIAVTVANPIVAQKVYFLAQVENKEPPRVTVKTSTQSLQPDGYSAAWGSFDDAIAATGWAVLDVHTSRAFSDEVQMYAAGFAEGVVSRERSFQYLTNGFAKYARLSVPTRFEAWRPPPDAATFGPPRDAVMLVVFRKDDRKGKGWTRGDTHMVALCKHSQFGLQRHASGRLHDRPPEVD